MIRLYTDAAVNGNPGSAGVGLLILKDDQQKQLSIPLEGKYNNHHAEFIAVIHGLKWLIENHDTDEMTFIYTDSQIVSQSIEKKYAKNPISSVYLEEILELMAQFQLIQLSWVPEAKNKGADQLARRALRLATD